MSLPHNRSQFGNSQPDKESDKIRSTGTGQTSVTLSLGKKILPPLVRTSRPAWTHKDRASQACDHCRKSKVKCTGTLPCFKCKRENRDCKYMDTKKDVAVRQQKKMTLTNSTLKISNKKLCDLLAELLEQSAISDSYVERTEAILSAESDLGDFGMIDDGQSHSLASTLTKRRMSMHTSPTSPDDANADAGSTRDLDIIDEDPNRDQRTRAVGFIGKSSAINWVTRIKNVVSQDPSTKQEDPRNSEEAISGTLESCYYAQESDYEHIDEDSVNPYDWPEGHVIDQLVSSYFEIIHPVYPVIIENEFMQQLQDLRQTDPEDGFTEDNQRNLRLVNLIFAISARHAHVTRAPYVGSDNDHLIYVTRARKLGLDNRVLHRDFEVRHIVCIILYGVYQISTDQLNRAWVTIGTAVRHAQALGMHLRMKLSDLHEREQELRVRIWWTIFSLERHIDEVLGRPSCIAEHFIAAPMPMNIEQDAFNTETELSSLVPREEIERFAASATVSRMPLSLLGKSGGFTKEFLTSSFAHSFPITVLAPTFSTYFILRTQLSMITHEIMATVFAPVARHAHWSDVQRTIGTLEERLDEWRWGLPVVFNFTVAGQDDEEYKDRRNGLSMFYYSSRMLLFRSTLCIHANDDDSQVEDETLESRRWNSRAAGECVAAACKLVDRLPPPHNWRRLYDMLPWFDMLHHIVEAASVILLELAYKATHVPTQVEQLVARAKKTVNLLASMSAQSSSARRAWEIFHELLKQVVPRVGMSADDMQTDAPAPISWDHQRSGQDSRYANMQEENRDGDRTRNKNRLTENWVYNHSSTPRFSAPPLAPIDPATTSEDFIDMCNETMHDACHLEQHPTQRPPVQTWVENSYVPYNPHQDMDGMNAHSFFPPTTTPFSRPSNAIDSMNSSSNLNGSSGGMSSHSMGAYIQSGDGSNYYAARTLASDIPTERVMSASGYLQSDPMQQYTTRAEQYQRHLGS